MGDILQIIPSYNMRAVFITKAGILHRFPIALWALIDIHSTGTPILTAMVLVPDLMHPVVVDYLDPDYEFRGYEQIG